MDWARDAGGGADGRGEPGLGPDSDRASEEAGAPQREPRRPGGAPAAGGKRKAASSPARAEGEGAPRKQARTGSWGGPGQRASSQDGAAAARFEDRRGTGICEHQRRRSQCKEFGGSAFCEHQRRRSRCKDCGGSAICKHQRQRSKCKDCMKHAEESSAQCGRPGDAVGKRSAREAGLAQAGAVKQPRPT